MKQTFKPDWDLLEATRVSLREHMAARLAAQESEQRFRERVAAAFAELRGVIEAHDVQLESCDRDGNEYCDCLERQMKATIAALGLGDGAEEK